jgi:hypothetical protein
MAEVSGDILWRQLADCYRMMVMAELLDDSGHVNAPRRRHSWTVTTVLARRLTLLQQFAWIK